MYTARSREPEDWSFDGHQVIPGSPKAVDMANLSFMLLAPFKCFVFSFKQLSVDSDHTDTSRSQTKFWITVRAQDLVCFVVIFVDP